jgi:hypothetical protein
MEPMEPLKCFRQVAFGLEGMHLKTCILFFTVEKHKIDIALQTGARIWGLASVSQPQDS